MRKAIATAPRNGDFVILEDNASGTYAVARWSVDSAQWLDDEGKPTQFSATHWHLPQTTLGPVNEVDSLPDPGAFPAKGGSESATPQQHRVEKQRKARNAQSETAGLEGGSKAQPADAPASDRIRPRRYGIPTMVACLLAGAAIGPLLYHGDFGTLLHARPVDPEKEASSKQALQQELELATRLANDATAARREAESRAASLRDAGDVLRQEKAAGDNTIAQLRQALQAELAKANDLTAELAEAQRNILVQTALAQKATDEGARAEAERDRVTGELRQALRQQEDKLAQASLRANEQLALKLERDKAEKLRVELVAARREAESRTAILRSANDEATRLKEASARTADELRQAQDKAEKLGGELAATRQEVEARTAAARDANAEAQRVVESSKRTADEQGQALRDAQGKAETLAADLAAARQEAQAQAAAARAASTEAQRVVESSKRTADEQGKALRDAQGKAETLAADLVAARQEAQAQVAAARAASTEAQRAVESSKRTADEQGKALREAQSKAQTLAADLTAARQEAQAQTAAAEAANAEARQMVETGKRTADEQARALRETQDDVEKLRAELAEARRELGSQVSSTSSMKRQLAEAREASERSAGEQQHALQQEQDKMARLVVELAEARSRLEALASPRPAKEAADGNQPATMRNEFQTAAAEAPVSSASLEAGRTQLTEPGSVPTSPQPPNPQAVRLIARANLLLEQGNIGGARNMLDLAAELGSREALFWLAETYDPLVLSARQTFGTQSDIAKARELYGKALAGGVNEAQRRLEALQQRAGGR